MTAERVWGYSKFNGLKIHGFYLVSRGGYYYSQYPWVINTDRKDHYTEDEFNKARENRTALFFETKKDGIKVLIKLAEQLEDMHPELKGD